MTKTLFLLRHAKAMASTLKPDRERPLSWPGREAAQHLGLYFRTLSPVPSLILCSPAKRTRDTLALLLEQWGGQPEVIYDDQLYLKGPESLLARAAKAEDKHAAAMLVGHNPDLALAALRLAKEGDSEALSTLKQDYPPGSLAIIDLAIPHWQAIAPFTNGRLTAFIRPQDIEH